MIHKSRGIVLHSLKFGDNGLITTIYTEEFGRMSFIMQGIHRKKSSVKANLLSQLSILEMEIDYKPGRELQRVREIKNISPFLSIPYVIYKSTQALFLAELLNKVLREEEPHSGLFSFLFHSIQVLDLLEEGTGNFHLLFLVQLSRYLGFAPTNNYSDSNSLFDMQAGKFVGSPPFHPWFLKEPESTHFSRLMDIGFQNLKELNYDQRIRTVLLGFILDYYGLHIGNKLNLKSLEILREILS